MDSKNLLVLLIVAIINYTDAATLRHKPCAYNCQKDYLALVEDATNPSFLYPASSLCGYPGRCNNCGWFDKVTPELVPCKTTVAPAVPELLVIDKPLYPEASPNTATSYSNVNVFPSNPAIPPELFNYLGSILARNPIAPPVPVPTPVTVPVPVPSPVIVPEPCQSMCSCPCPTCASELDYPMYYL